jgi:hypothetical protein
MKYAPLALMGGAALMGNQPPQGFGQLMGQAQQEAKQADLMRGYLASGTLPPNMQASVDAATQSAEATIRSRHAQMGSSGSSAEEQELASARLQAKSTATQIASQLFNAGVSESQMADGMLYDLMNIQMQRDANLSAGIGKLSGAMAQMAGYNNAQVT